VLNLAEVAAKPLLSLAVQGGRGYRPLDQRRET
jgi:hypothetical protein